MTRTMKKSVLPLAPITAEQESPQSDAKLRFRQNSPLRKNFVAGQNIQSKGAGPAYRRNGGFTLLELLLALGLAILVFSMIWELLHLYSGHYYLAERKVARSQLIRSLAELLDDDLMSAIQDPILPLDSFQAKQSRFVRRFGLRGDATSLQIDVVEPDVQTTVADSEENRRYATGMSSVKGIQVPELKTIIYEFVSPGTLQKTQDDSSQIASGSTLVGSLSTPPGQTDSLDFEVSPLPPDGSNEALQRFASLSQRYGLSRQELDFETPTATEKGSIQTDPTGGSSLIGSLTTPPDISQSRLHADSPQETALSFNEHEPVLTAVQLASLTENHTRWAPEVVELQFRYFDGTRWVDSWNSLEKNGLPLAIEVQLKLMPLDEIDSLRSSPLYLEYEQRRRRVGQDESGSRFIGSLQTSPTNISDSFDAEYNLTLDATEVSTTTPQTLEEVVAQLGLTTPQDCRVVSWLPTTPLAHHQALKRRQPIPDDHGPYSLDADRRPNVIPSRQRDRSADSSSDRIVRDRTPITRASSDFAAIDTAKHDFESTAETLTQRSPRESQQTSMSAPQQTQTARTSNAGGWLRGERKTQKP